LLVARLQTRFSPSHPLYSGRWTVWRGPFQAPCRRTIPEATSPRHRTTPSPGGSSPSPSSASASAPCPRGQGGADALLPGSRVNAKAPPGPKPSNGRNSPRSRANHSLQMLLLPEQISNALARNTPQHIHITTPRVVEVPLKRALSHIMPCSLPIDTPQGNDSAYPYQHRTPTEDIFRRDSDFK